MTATAELVVERIEEDLVLREAMARGIVNFRALARWLIDASGWDTSESSVISALRRHTPEAGEDVFAEARAVLSSSHVNTRSRMCSIQLHNEPHIHEALPELFGTIDATQGETLRIISSDKGFRIIVDERNFKRAVNILNARHVDRVLHNLTELSIMIPPEGWETPGILALVCSRLALRGINVAGIVDGVYQDIVLVDEEDGYEAYEALASIAGQGMTSEHGAPPASPPASQGDG